MARNGKNKTGKRKQGLDTRQDNRSEKNNKKHESPGARMHKKQRMIEDKIIDKFSIRSEYLTKGFTMEFPKIKNSGYSELFFYLDEMDEPQLFEDRLRALLTNTKMDGDLEFFSLSRTFPRWDKKERIPMLIMKCK